MFGPTIPYIFTFPDGSEQTKQCQIVRRRNDTGEVMLFVVENPEDDRLCYTFPPGENK